MLSQLTLFTTTVWVSISLNLFSTCSAQNTYHVSSTTDSACPSEPCLNFYHYIQNSETYFTSNTTFIFRPGDHIIHKRLVIANLSTLEMIGSNLLDGRKSRILCTSPSVFIKLLSVSNAEFNSLEFISCGVQGHRIPAMYLYRVNYFELTNCTFQQSRNTALYAFESTVILTGNNFINNSANQYGGAIYAVSSIVYLQGKNTLKQCSEIWGCHSNGITQLLLHHRKHCVHRK